jgi:hypothetical protein
MPEARQNSSRLSDMFESASSFSALVGTATDVVGLFMALLSSVESSPRAYRLKASNAASPISTSIGTIPAFGAYKKNDQAFVELKNGAFVRRLRASIWVSRSPGRFSSRIGFFNVWCLRSTFPWVIG